MIAVRSTPTLYTLQSPVNNTVATSPATAHLSVEGYGQTGPYRRAAGYDVVIEGEGMLELAFGVHS